MCGGVVAVRAGVRWCGCSESGCVVVWLQRERVCGGVVAARVGVWWCGCSESGCVVVWLQ